MCKPSILYPEDGEQKIEDTQTQQNWVLKTILKKTRQHEIFQSLWQWCFT